ncbi:MAG: EamA family transporter [Gammaproteobacteria bacterium]|nr:EamA family transporter [Gammaproteobacteria bacterium]MDH5239773.1 EamA family transporter [Gammaproteobacteria bacterium]MDH5260551.1 EamA family transporter [Gammaproteobacteria bacterium]MDH5582300.1 EamA family transporter [Gammaproteobacteria bacterium]
MLFHRSHTLRVSPLSNTFLYLIAVLIWGSTWLAIEFQLGVVAPEVSIVYRYLAASAILFIWCKVKGLNTKFNLKSHQWFALMGLLMFCLNYILAYHAQMYITSALSAIAFSSMLWMNIINSRLFFGARVGARIYLGATLGVAGIIVLFGPQVGEISLSDGVFFGSLLAIMGALMASFGNMVSQGAQKAKLPVVQSNAWSMLYGGLMTLVVAVFQGHEFTFDPSVAYLASLAYLTVFGSVIAFGAYLTLLGRIGAYKAGYASVMFPVVALVLSMLFEGLALDTYILAGFSLVLAGNLLVLTRGRKTY